MQILKRIAASLFKVVALVVTLYFVSLIVIRLAGFEFSVVMSNSMRPALVRGDLVILKNVDRNELKKDDVIQFKKGDSYVVHRIYEFEPDGIRLKGDANPGPDPILVQKNQVFAIAVGSLRRFGDPILWIQNLIGVNVVEAKFTHQQFQNSSLRSSIWIDPVAKWKQIYGGGTYTFTSPSSVTSSGSGNRTILLSKNKTADQNFYTLVRLTNKDPSSSAIYLNLEVCLPASSMTCGWAIGINESGKFVSVHTYSASGNRELPIFFKSFSPNLTAETKIVCHISASLLQVRINDVIVINLTNPYALAQSKGVTIPTGSYFGFSTTNSNQYKSAKTLTW